MLAAALGVVEAMAGADTSFDDLMIRYLGKPLPQDFLVVANSVRKIRNDGSHRLLDDKSYKELLRLESDRNVLPLLTKVKRWCKCAPN